jgi:hypothetical protein
MAFPAPNAVLRGTCTGAADLLTQLQTYFDGVSTSFGLSAGVAYDAGDSLCIEPLGDPGPSTDWQLNIRRTSTTAFKTQLDPSGTITDAGSTGAGPTGASTMASFEDDWTLQTAAAAVTFFVAEWDDAIMIVTRHSTAGYQWEGCHCGRVYAPCVADVDGLDGLANLCGDVGIAASIALWLPHDSSVSDSSVRVGATGVQATDWPRTLSTSPTGAGTATNRAGKYWPSPVALFSGSRANMIGTLKYIYCYGQTDTADTRLEDPDTGVDRWLYLAPSATPTYYVIPWLDNTSPFPA